MMLIGENKALGSKSCPIAIMSTTNPTWTGMVVYKKWGKLE